MIAQGLVSPFNNDEDNNDMFHLDPLYFHWLDLWRIQIHNNAYDNCSSTLYLFATLYLISTFSYLMIYVEPI